MAYKFVTDSFMVLDIETSKENDYEGKPFVTWLSYGYCILYDTHFRKIKKCFFREWKEIIDFFKYIQFIYHNKQIICYIHNLSFDGDFIIKNVSRPSKILCNGSHKLIYLETEDFPEIAFKCSYMLTSKPLAELGRIVNLPKLDNSYETIYPDDEVSQEDKDYCERDCDIVAKYIIEQFLPQYKYIQNIPYTKTGIVRQRFKELAKDENTGWDCYPDEDCYDLLNRAYRGAITISNPKYTGIMLENVRSFDETSEYPSQMLAQQYPYNMHKVDPANYELIDYKLFNKITGKEVPYFIGSFYFTYIRRIYDWVWLSQYKTEDVDPFTVEWYNGKLRECRWYQTSLTNIDLECVFKTYCYKTIEIKELITCEDCVVDYLPKPYFDLLIEYGTKKTNIKNKLKQMEKDGKDNTYEYEMLDVDYMKAKNDFNSIYGMLVQKLIPQEFEVDEDYYWLRIDPEYKKLNKRLYRNFYYGVYITAYARRNLINNIIHNCPYTFVYSDTDSIKMLDGNFEDVNIDIHKDYVNMPCFKNFGHFDDEGLMSRFITWGAKKYAYEKDGCVYGVVAGLPKFKKLSADGMERYIDSFDKFYLGKTFEKCKLAHMYLYISKKITEIDEKITDRRELTSDEIHFIKENNIKTNGGCVLFEVSYKLDITDDDKRILDIYGNYENRFGKELENG